MGPMCDVSCVSVSVQWVMIDLIRYGPDGIGSVRVFLKTIDLPFSGLVLSKIE